MRVQLYLIGVDGCWSARWSIALEADKVYWGRKAEERRKVQGGRKFGGREREESIVMHVWRTPLPLSAAEEAAVRWSEENGGRELEERAALREFVKAAQVAGGIEAGGEMNVDKGNGRTERVVFGERGAGQNGKNIGFVEEECVRAVAARLYGRAALLSEAQELLAAGPPACQAVAAGGWSALAPALQWAALRGLVRLRCAVAPQQPTASPLGRLLLPAPMRRGRPWRRRCLRCGSGEARMNRTACAACGSSACAYCEACLTMGRSRECGLLIHGGGEAGLADAQGAAMSGAAPGLAASRAHRMHAPAAFAARWGLSPAQQAAAEAALSYVLPRLGGVRHSSSTNQNAPSRWAPARSITHHSASQPTICASLNQQAALSTADIPDTQPITSSHTRDTESSRPSSAPSVSQFLIWAVTGAGKTEMVFPLIEAALSFGGRALIATPRRDVVLELDPRLRRAFPGAAVVTLYGGSEQRWEDGDITIATTHQLFRFHERFDLVIIDELDAFPYHGDPQLHYAAAKAGVPGGAVILLSATPPRAMQKSVRKGQIGCARVPVRFHRHPLPVPQQIRMPRVAELLAKHKLPRLLLARLTSSLARGAQCFVFVQQIRHTEPLAQLLRTALPGIPIGATSSKDAERPQHVLAFRNREFRVLVTTTILERGVTVPFSDVFILDADGKLFDEASLVQMAGRAGRSKDDPNGRVYFFASTSNQSQRRAIAQIKSMNREAKKNGYLLPQ